MFAWVLFSFYVFGIIGCRDYAGFAADYVKLLGTKPIPMDKIEKFESDEMKSDMTEAYISTMMKPFKTFDKILFSKEMNVTVPGMRVIEVAAQFRYSVKQYDFSFNIIFHINVCTTGKIFKKPIICGLKWFYNWTAPSYANTSSFDEINVEVGPLLLPGILSIPKDVDPIAIGSGPGDQDETYKGMKPFKDIAWGLASKGIAVLRYPKRYYLHRPVRNNETIEEEYMIDTEAAIDLLFQKFSMPIVPIALSEGGKIVPLLALRKQKKIRGFVTLAGEVQHMVPVNIRQYKYLAECYNHTLTPADFKNLADMQKVETLLEEGKLPDDYVLPLPLSMFNPAYLKSLYAVDTVGITNGLEDMDFLVTNGDKDYQVTIETDLSVWQKNNTNENVVFKIFEGVDHFQNIIEGKPVPWNYDTPQNVLKEIIDVISDFIIEIHRK